MCSLTSSKRLIKNLNKLGKQSFTTRFNIICNLKYQYSKLVSQILDNHLQFPTLTHKFKWLFCTEPPRFKCLYFSFKIWYRKVDEYEFEG